MRYKRDCVERIAETYSSVVMYVFLALRIRTHVKHHLDNIYVHSIWGYIFCLLTYLGSYPKLAKCCSFFEYIYIHLIPLYVCLCFCVCAGFGLDTLHTKVDGIGTIESEMATKNVGSIKLKIERTRN